MTAVIVNVYDILYMVRECSLRKAMVKTIEQYNDSLRWKFQRSTTAESDVFVTSSNSDDVTNDTCCACL